MAIIPAVRCSNMRNSLAFYTAVLDFERVDGDDDLDDPSFSVLSRGGTGSCFRATAGAEVRVSRQHSRMPTTGGFMRRRVLAALLVSAIAPSVARAQDATADSAEAARVVSQFHAALAAGDSLAALALLADDAVVLEAGGLETRAEYRAHHLAADIEFAQAVPSTAGPTLVTVRRGVAWAITATTTTGTFQGRAVNSAGAELMVLTHDHDVWRIRAIHWSSRRRSAP